MAEPREQQSRDLVVHAREAAPSEPNLYSNSWAVVIGINSYRDPRVPSLRFAEHDAQAVAEQLPSVGFPPENITLLLASRHPEKIESSQLLKLLHDDLHEKMNKEDQFLFYFAGHGVTSLLDDERRGYLLLPASRIGGEWPSRQHPELEDVPAGALDTGTLRDIVTGLRPKHKLVVLDACFSGLIVQPRAFYGPLEVSDSSIALWTKKRVTQILTAGGAGEQALENDSYRHGLFTHFLLRGLDDAVRPGQKIVPAFEISSYVKERVSAEGPQNPRSQNYGDGEFLFVRKPVRGKESQVRDLCALAASALDRGDWNGAESTLRAAQAVAGDSAELLAPIAPLAARIDAARAAARAAALVGEAEQALAVRQLAVASAKLAEAEKLSKDAAHTAAIARIKSGIDTATAEITCAAYLRDAEAALTSGNWKTAQSKLNQAKGVCPSGSKQAKQEVAAFEKKLQEFANGCAPKLLGEANDAIKARKFSTATGKLAEARALPVSDAAVAKSIADAQASLALAKKQGSEKRDTAIAVIGAAVVCAVIFFILKISAPYLALTVKSDFWGMIFTSTKTWLASLHWYGWAILITVGIVAFSVGQKKDGAAVWLVALWLLWKFGPTLDHSVIDRLLGKPVPPAAVQSDPWRSLGVPGSTTKKPDLLPYMYCGTSPCPSQQVLEPTPAQPSLDHDAATLCGGHPCSTKELLDILNRNPRKSTGFFH